MQQDMQKAKTELISIEMWQSPIKMLYMVAVHQMLHSNANEDNADFINNEDDVVAHVLDDDDVVMSDDDEVNSVKFMVHERDILHTTQNSGVSTPGLDGEMYYGQLEEIMELIYIGPRK
ncbi:hypothetical protein Tco_0147973, partial [Tanacetum coccineum]